MKTNKQMILLFFFFQRNQSFFFFLTLREPSSLPAERKLFDLMWKDALVPVLLLLSHVPLSIISMLLLFFLQGASGLLGIVVIFLSGDNSHFSLWG